jgi:L-ascorbate metabolism protein UlaG (beta-lactamase superfamily)
MDIYWYGQAMFKIKGKNATVVTDPFVPDFVGLKLPKDLDADVITVSHDHDDHNNAGAVNGEPILFKGPGEYERKSVAVIGVASFHDDQKGAERGKNTIYNIMIDGLNIVHLGDLGQEALTQEQISEIGGCDILMIPVGGVFTIDGKAAAEIVAQLEPKIIIPMHYKTEGLKFELEPVDNFLKAFGVESPDPIMKFSITRDKLSEEAKVVVMLKS